MKVRELVNSCQNQWKGLFTLNEDFIVSIESQCNGKKIKLPIRIWLEKVVYDLFEVNHKLVLAWEMISLNEINILVREL